MVDGSVGPAVAHTISRGQTVVVTGGPETRYARSEDGTHVAYQIIGDGPLDLVTVGYGNNISIDMRDEESHVRRFEERLASFSRLIRFDPRWDRVSPTRCRQALGLASSWSSTTSSQCSTPSVRLGPAFSRSEGAAWQRCSPQRVHPGRVLSLALLHCYARLPRDEDYPFGIPQALLTTFIEAVVNVGGAEDPAMDDVDLLAPSLSGDPVFREWWARAGRRGASPAAARANMEMSFAGDVRSALPLIDAPTLVLHRDPSLFSVGHGHDLAEHLARARLVVLPGGDHLPVRREQRRCNRRD